MIERLMAFVRHKKFISFQIALVLAGGIGLRFTNLGYSNFQGDEISAICHPSHFNSVVKFLGFLLGQRKGPVQYVVTCAYGLIDPSFSSEFALRLPSAIAGSLSLVCLVVIAWILFDHRVAIYAGFLFATNGIFVAQARFVQYQAFVVLGTTAGIMGLVLAINHARWRLLGLYLGAVAAAGALLAHFDGAWALPPMGLLALYWWKREKDSADFARARKHFFAAGAIYAALVLTFYVEYARRLGAFQLDYWASRFTGPSTNTLHVFQFYNPGPVAWIYLAAILLALTRLRWSMGWQVMLMWVIPPMIFMELIFKDSRASAYTYLLPLAIIAGIGFNALFLFLRRLTKDRWSQLIQVGLLVIYLGLGYMTYDLLDNHNPEYPWQSKNVLGMVVPGGNLVGTFGMPYNRDWHEIGAWFRQLPAQEKVAVTNEKLQIAEFYLPSDVQFKYIWRNAPGERPQANQIYFLVVDRPQSWINQVWGLTPEQWRQKFTPIRTFADAQGQPVAWLYFLDPTEQASLVH